MSTMSPRAENVSRDPSSSEGITILIFDGGQTGTTEYSSLRILHEIISRRAYDLDVDESELKPCDLFDMFCGTGVGGVFAILFGRLHLSVQDVIAWYLKAFRILFSSDAWRNKDPVEALELFNTVLKDIPSNIDLDDPLVDKASSKGFTCTVNPIHFASARLLRTYRVRSNASPKCTIREALQASFADQVHLHSPEFGSPVSETFCAANHNFNNPTGLLLEELPKAFEKDNARVACIISLGTGHPGILSLSPAGPSFEQLERLTRDSEQMARMYESRFGGLEGFFFRFSVNHGFQSEDVPPEDRREKQLGSIQTHTEQYLNIQASSLIDQLVDVLARRPAVELCDRLGSLTGPYAKDKITAEVSVLRQNVLTQVEDQQRRDLRDWITPGYSLEDEVEDLYQHGRGSGQWLLNSDKMRSWIAGDFRLLVLTGPPGCGKSIISALTDQFLRNDNTRHVFTVIIKYSSKMTVTNILERLTVQLLSGTDTVPSALLELLAERRRSCEKLREVLASAFDEYQRPVHLILDALDEFSSANPRDVICLLLSLSQDVRLFVTSRPLPDKVFDFPSCEIFSMESSNSEDLELFIKDRISMFEFRPTPTDTEFLESKVFASSQEIFLLAAFNVQLLSECLDTYSACNKAERLPQTSDERYEASMDRIRSKPAERSETAMLALTWVCHAKRELTLEELQHAVACTKHNLSGRDVHPALTDHSTLLEICDGLIVVSGIYVGFVHLTAQSYFESSGSACFSEYQPRLSIGSLRYLNAKHSVKNLKMLCTRTYEESFFTYCVTYWGDHPHVDAITNEFDELCANPDVFHLVAVFRRRALDSSFFICHGETPPTPLHIAASFGLVKWMLRLRDKSQINSVDSSGSTPLHYAARAGQSQATKVLVSWEHVDVNSRDEVGDTPLSRASYNGHIDVVRALLEKVGIDVNSRDEVGNTPLSLASYNGHLRVVRALLEKEGIDVSSPNNNGRTTLSLASYNGHLDVVRALLEKEGIDVNSRDEVGDTPLSQASYNGHIDVVRALLEKEDTELNSQNRDGDSPLSLASGQGHLKVVQSLLVHEGIKLNSRNGYGATPLLLAAFYGYLDVVQALLEKEGIDVNSRDNFDRTPLSEAIHDIDVVQALLGKEGIDVNSQDGNGNTPLQYASWLGYLDIVRVLLGKEGIDVNFRDEAGDTALLTASDNGHLDVVRALLGKEGIDVNSRNNFGETPLTVASRKNNLEIVQVLLAHEAIDV